MKTYRCRVHHAGNRDMAIDKTGVTPAEIVLLKHVHGADSVVAVEFERDRSVQQAKERARLADLYGRKVFAQVYPGSVPRLPMDLSEAGLREDGGDIEIEEPLDEDVEPITETPANGGSPPLPAALRERAAKAAGATLT